MEDSRTGKGGARVVVARVVSQKGHCELCHQVGDEVVFDGERVEGRICLHAMYSMLPKVFALCYDASFPWLADPDVAAHACPDAENPVVFEVRRLPKEPRPA
jgi:uncharacterized repeat protein (TIGR04076 family)